MSPVQRTLRCPAGTALLFALALLGQVLSGADSSEPSTRTTLPVETKYVLGPQDQLRIWALGIDEIPDRPIQIDANGNLDLPVVGRIHASGLTIEEFRATLLKRLEAEVWNPQASVEIVEFGSQPVSVLGAVNTPGVHQLKGRKTLAEVLSLAGGLRPDAGYSIKISRPVDSGPISLPTASNDPTGKFTVAEVKVSDLMGAKNPAENIRVEPHDVITVPVAEMVYVIGTVLKPGGFVLRERENVSVLQALSMAEGFAPAAAPQRARILRPAPENSERVEIAINLKRVLSGQDEDVMLKPNDILFVPSSTSKKAAVRALDAAIYTATGIAIWRR